MGGLARNRTGLPSNGQSFGRTGIKANIDTVNETIRYIPNKRCIRLIAQ